jgi:hypothetical protein
MDGLTDGQMNGSMDGWALDRTWHRQRKPERQEEI